MIFPSLEGRNEETLYFSEWGCLPAGRQGLLSNEQNPERSVATKDHQGTEAGNIIKRAYYLKLITHNLYEFIKLYHKSR